jgi:hypothetical protein
LERLPTQQRFITNCHQLTCTQSGQEESSSGSSNSREGKVYKKEEQVGASEQEQGVTEQNKEEDVDGEQSGTGNGEHQSDSESSNKLSCNKKTCKKDNQVQTKAQKESTGSGTKKHPQVRILWKFFRFRKMDNASIFLIHLIIYI